MGQAKMDLITFFFTTILAFSGLLIGALLAHYTRDEIHDVKHALPYLQSFVFIVIFFTLFAYFNFWPILILMVLSAIFILIFWHKNNLNRLDYVVFPLYMVISSLNPEAHLYVTLVIFCFGIFSGVLYYVMHTKPEDKKKHSKKIKHHKHSNKHLTLDKIEHQLFMDYYYFIIIALVAYAATYIVNFVGLF